jgi:hypothetical protein
MPLDDITSNFYYIKCSTTIAISRKSMDKKGLYQKLVYNYLMASNAYIAIK